MAIITLPAGSTSEDLQTTINQAASGDVIELSGDMAFFGTVTVPVELFITIQSTTGDLRIMTQTALERHFFVPGDLTLSNIIINGDVSATQTTTVGGLEVSGSLNLLGGAIIQACSSSDGGAVSLSGGTLNVQGGYIRDNYSATGGGVYVTDGGFINMSSGLISSNTAGDGGGVYLDEDSTFAFGGGIIEGNTAVTQGGGICVDSSSALYMQNGTITDNRITYDSGKGGGVCVLAGGYFEMSGGSITRNSLNLAGAQGGVGGGVSVGGGEFVMTEGIISYNQSIQYGAGVCISAGGTLTMSGGSIASNTAETAGGGEKLSGGGIAVINGIVNMSSGIISGNEAVFGGGVYLGYAGTVCQFNMVGGIVEDNYASAYGGGIHTQNTGASVIIGEPAGQGIPPTIRNNRTAYGGGGISDYASSVSVSNGAVHDNEAIYGGGVYVFGGGECRIDNSMISDNTAAYSGGGVFTDDYDYTNPASQSAYQNISTSSSTVFTGNKAAAAYEPPENAESFTNIDYLTSSIAGDSEYIHPLNNYDINYQGLSMLVLYQVTYDANGGTGVFISENLPAGTTYTVLSPEAAGISRAGYSFAGWNTQPNGSGTGYEPGAPLVITEDVILYAQWILVEVPYNVTYDANSGTGGLTTEDLPVGTIYTVLSPDAVGISRPGYSFAGWNTEPDGGGIYYEPGDTFVITEDVTLYAQWTLIQGPYDVIYDANGGLGSYGDTEIPRGTEYTVLSLVETGISRPDYTFVGWNTERDGSGMAYQPGDIIPVTGNVILYAQWEPLAGTYRILYCPNCPCCCASYNSCCCMVLGVSLNAVYTVLPPKQIEVCCPCHVFTGWNTLPDGRGTAYRPGDTIQVTEDVTFYAQWIPCKRPKKTF